MRLIDVTFDGYKRFHEKTMLTIGSKIVALIGPNEAGKTSVLRGLASLNDNRSLLEERTRNQTPNPDHVMIIAKFLLDSADLEGLENLGLAPSPHWFSILKYADGALRYNLSGSDNEWSESQTLEQTWQELSVLDQKLEAAATNVPEIKQMLLNQGNYMYLKGCLDKEKLERNRDSTVGDHATSLASAIIQLAIEDTKLPETRAKMMQFFEKLGSLTKLGSRGALISWFSRKIRFLEFGETHRDLRATQAINSISEQSAVANLVALGNIDWKEIQGSLASTNREQAKILLRRASDRITDYLKDFWGQSSLGISLDLDGDQFEVRVVDNKQQIHVLDERSDGFRRFLALIAFVHRFGRVGQTNILLIDEAETHLHYEAQADLIRTLGSQTVVKQVIYTTHSPGCLPEDLMAVRAIVPNREDGTSTIEKDIWTDRPDVSGRRGVQRLFYLAGASTMAFSAVRNAVISEGKADFILLPRMLKEVLKRDYLGFQVLPNFANVASLEEAEADTARLAFIVDGDDAGRKYVAKLRDGWCVSENRIYQLEDGLEIEDYLKPEIYVKAVNKMLEHMNPKQLFTVDDLLPEKSMTQSLEIWCKTNNNKKTPGKRTVAQRVLDIADYADLIVEPSRQQRLLEIGNKLLKLFGLE